MFYRFHVELGKPNAFAAREAIVHDLGDPHAQANIQDHEFPDFEPKFADLRLTDESSLVDFVDDGSATGGLGLLVSRKALGVLRKLRLPPHRAYPLDVTHRQKKIQGEYFWLQILSVPFHEWIDYSRSVFRLKSQFDMDDQAPGEAVTLEDAAQLRALIQTLGEQDRELRYSRLVLNDNYGARGYDIFYLDPLDGIRAFFPVVSDRGRQALETSGLVGYTLRELPALTA